MVGINRFAFRGRTQIPAGTKKTSAAGDDGHAQSRVVLQLFERRIERAAGCHIDGIGLGPIQRDGQHTI